MVTTERTVRKWIAAGRFPPPDLRLGRGLRWKIETLERFMENGKGE
jgi:hypothetical protein